MAVAFNSQGQAVTANPTVGTPKLRNDAGMEQSALQLSNLPFTVSVQVANLSANRSMPIGTSRITISLGGLLNIDTSSVKLNNSSNSISNYYTFTAVNIGGDVQIVGVQTGTVPPFFVDSIVFRAFATSVGNSFLTANIDPLIGLDDNDPNNNSSQASYTVTSTTLPVKLNNFNVVRVGCNIDVNYSAEEQINVNRFEVQASKNGTDFFSLGSIAAGFTTKYNGRYAITDAIKSSNLYVRLKTIDNDGQFQFSEVKRIAGTCDGGRSLVLSVYPNPIRSGSLLTINSREGSFNGKYSVSLLDVTGRTLTTQEMQLNNVSNFKFNVGNLTSGQYLLRVFNSELNESAVVGFQKN